MALSYTHESDFRQERDFGQKISATFEFIGTHWRPLGRVMLYLVVPLALLQGVMTALLQSQLLNSMGTFGRGAYSGRGRGGTGMLDAQRAMLGASLQNPVYYLTIILSTLLTTMLVLSIYGYVVCCLRPAGTMPADITPGEVWAAVRARLVGTFFSFYGVFIIIALGMFALALPGIYLSVALSIFFIVSLVEHTSFFTTVQRCLSLTRGKWWSTFGVMFIMLILLYLLLTGFTIVLGLVGVGLRSAIVPLAQNMTVFGIVIAALGTFFKLLLYPPILLVLAFQYFNLVERHDGVGMQQLVSQLGQTPAAGPTSATYHPSDEGEY
jgi:hypothetical protein